MLIEGTFSGRSLDEGKGKRDVAALEGVICFYGYPNELHVALARYLTAGLVKASALRLRTQEVID